MREQETGKNNIEGRGRLVKHILLLLAAAFLIELLVFNFRSLQSAFYRESSWTDYESEIAGIKEYDGGVLSIQEDEAAIRIRGIGADVKNICLDLEVVNPIPLNYVETGVCKAEIYVTDEGNAVNNLLAVHTVSHANPASKYQWLQTSGNVDELIVVISMPTGHLLKINDIKLNARRPVIFSRIRCMILFGVLLLCYGLRGNSSWWREDGVKMDPVRKAVITALFLFFFGVSWYLMNSNSLIYGVINPHDPTPFYDPYRELAWALDAGQASLLDEPSAELMAMENPYDHGLRLKNGIDFKFDFAYFDGKYYVYQGILPCLIFYLPMYHLLGLNMPVGIPVFAAGLLFAIGFLSLLRQIIRRYFPGTPFAMLVLIALTGLFGCQLPFFITQPTSYILPILSASALTVWGLFFWIGAGKEGENSCSTGKLAAGSFCMAGVAACRPTMLLYSALAVALFGRGWLARSDGDAKKERTREMIAFAVPYIAVAVPLMYYNAIRFGSPFEFGAKYNLTGFDLTHLKFSFDRIYYAGGEYLLRAPEWNYFFPYLNGYEAEWIHDGHTAVIFDAGVKGGLIPFNLFLIAVFVVFEKKKGFKEKKLFGLCASLLAIAAVMLVFDVEYTGSIIYRYLADFSFAIFTAAWCGILYLQENYAGQKAHDAFRRILLVSVLLSVGMNAMMWFVEGYKYPLSSADTQLYYRIFYAFNFW